MNQTAEINFYLLLNDCCDVTEVRRQQTWCFLVRGQLRRHGPSNHSNRRLVLQGQVLHRLILHRLVLQRPSDLRPVLQKLQITETTMTEAVLLRWALVLTQRPSSCRRSCRVKNSSSFFSSQLTPPSPTGSSCSSYVSHMPSSNL